MKKNTLILLALGLSFITACEKNEIVVDETVAEKAQVTVPTIIGVIDDAVKTAYDGEGKFSWIAGDLIKVQVEKAGSYDRWGFTADEGTASSKFTSALNGSSQNYAEAGWSLGNYAFYCDNVPYYTYSFSNSSTPTFTLPSYTYDYYSLSSGDDFKAVPLIGEKVSGDGEATVTYRFQTATGILKLNFSGVPNVGGLRLMLDHPTYPLCGTFSIAADNTIKAENYVSGKSVRTLEPSGGFSTAYITPPIGTIPAGLVITLYKTTGELYCRVVTNKSIEIKKNTVVNLSQPLVALYSSVAISGDMTNSPSVEVTISGSETVKFAVAATEEAGYAALASASTSATGSYDQSALAPGNYYLCYKVFGADGHSYIKNSIPFTKNALPKIALVEGDLSTNSVHNGDGTGLAGLVDNNTASGYHYHSNWGSDQHYDATYGIWIDIDLTDSNARTSYALRYCTRSNQNNHAKHVRIYASDDKATWGDPLADVANALSGIDANAGAWTELIPFSTGTAKRYIRLAIVENSNGADLTKSSEWGSDQHYVHIAEMELYGE